MHSSVFDKHHALVDSFLLSFKNSSRSATRRCRPPKIATYFQGLTVVEVAHKMQEAASGRHSTRFQLIKAVEVAPVHCGSWHGTSDSHRPANNRDILNMHDSVELQEPSHPLGPPSEPAVS
jgi:hypothetical protein